MANNTANLERIICAAIIISLFSIVCVIIICILKIQDRNLDLMLIIIAIYVVAIGVIICLLYLMLQEEETSIKKQKLDKLSDVKSLLNSFGGKMSGDEIVKTIRAYYDAVTNI